MPFKSSSDGLWKRDQMLSVLAQESPPLINRVESSRRRSIARFFLKDFEGGKRFEGAGGSQEGNLGSPTTGV